MFLVVLINTNKGNLFKDPHFNDPIYISKLHLMVKRRFYQHNLFRTKPRTFLIKGTHHSRSVELNFLVSYVGRRLIDVCKTYHVVRFRCHEDRRHINPTKTKRCLITHRSLSFFVL